ncbi:Abi-alpha family protein [Aequorivita nionensis]|uniref:Abi-alpha family protein n=1 Tax=Aequorivita nionensis TaxID=1287690 RepID=UPI003965D195
MNDKELNIKSSTIEKGLDLAKDFLGKLIFPAVEEVGLLMGDNIKVWRFKNQIRLLNNVENYVKEKNISTKKVPLKILLPLLENASLEEDENIIELWGNLLSNYIDSSKSFKSAVFPKILAEINTIEATFLKNHKTIFDAVYKEKRVCEYIEMQTSKYKISKAEISNLMRLGLIEEVKTYYSINDVSGDFPGSVEEGEIYLSITGLGEEFLEACNL